MDLAASEDLSLLLFVSAITHGRIRARLTRVMKRLRQALMRFFLLVDMLIPQCRLLLDARLVKPVGHSNLMY
jgi:hypothetical protein